MPKHLAHRAENNLRHIPHNVCTGKHCAQGLHGRGRPPSKGPVTHRPPTMRERAEPAYLPVVGSEADLSDEEMLRYLNNPSL